MEFLPESPSRAGEMAQQNTTTVVKHPGRVPKTPSFPETIHRKSPQIAYYYGDSQILRRSIFSTAGSFEDSIKIRGRDEGGDDLRVESSFTRYATTLNPKAGLGLQR